MDFIDYTIHWAKAEIAQGRLMILTGIIFSFITYAAYNSPTSFYRGTFIPLLLLLFILIGYGAYIMYSRPIHAEETIALFEVNPSSAIDLEKIKHASDNNLGNLLLRFVYPTFIIGACLLLLFIKDPYLKGLAIGLVLLFTTTYFIDSGFVHRSDKFLLYLQSIHYDNPNLP